MDELRKTYRTAAIIGLAMKHIVFASAVLFILVCSGCGPRNVYEGLRMHQGMDCQKLHGADQDECNRRSGMSYDEYERQRNQEKQSP